MCTFLECGEVLGCNVTRAFGVREQVALMNPSGVPQPCYVEIVVTIPGRRFGASLQVRSGCSVPWIRWDYRWSCS